MSFMTLEEIQKWCQAHGVQARGIFRGGDFLIPATAAGGSTPLSEVLHWELSIDGKRYPTSTSDLERLVSRRILLEDFVTMTGSREGR
jgi:hypothetical protein